MNALLQVRDLGKSFGGVKAVDGISFDLAPGELLALTAATLRASDPLRAAADYVETFDLRRRTTMYLTYWTAGDTRNRGSEMLAFAAACSRSRCSAVAWVRS